MSGLAEILEENSRLRRSLEERDAQLARVMAERDVVRTRVDQLEHALKLIELKQRGPTSQRFVPDDSQSTLPMFPDVEAPPRAPKVEPGPPADEANSTRGTAPASPSQRGLPRRRDRASLAHLPSRKVHCPASREAKCVACGGPLKVIGQATSFRVGWVPGHFVVEDVTRDKCACPSCPSEGVLTVPAPYALDRALCADSLLARIIIDKFADHLPLNRQVARMEREGLEVSSATVSSWIVQAADLLHRVAYGVKAELMERAFLQGDDTGFPVQDGGDGVLRKGRMWAFTDQEQVLYAFTDTKQGKFPSEILAGFQGECLLADGGSEFNQVVAAKDLERAGCWSHLRTYFVDALHFHPHEAALAIGTIRDLFLLERTFKDLAPAARLDGRVAESKPLVDGLYAWVKALAVRERPKSKLMEALTYATNQEDELRVFLSRGDIPIHNNLSELMLRQHVVGRKNWLFARSEGGAKAAATMFTLIGSCRLQGIDPHAYLVDVLGRVQDHPATRIRELTPRSWRLAKGHTIEAG